MVTIYDPEGKAVQRLSVDAKECIASGHYTAKPPEDEKSKVEKSLTLKKPGPKTQSAK